MADQWLQLCTKHDVLTTKGMVNDATEGKTRPTTLEEDIERLVQQVSRDFARACNRDLVLAEYTEVLDIGECQQTLSLRAYPIVSVASITEASDGVFAGVEPLAPTSYALRRQGRGGLITRRYDYWLAGPQTTQVVWTGGLAAHPDQVPEDLRGAAIQQVVHDYRREAHPHVNSMSTKEGAVTYLTRERWLPAMAQAIIDYGRYTS